MKSLKKNIILNSLIIISFVILSMISVIILYHTHILFGASDMPFHARRIIEWKESILHGELLPRYSFNEFNGSSVMTMYPYINLLPEVFLSFFIKSGINLIYFSFVVNIFLAFIISYYSCYNYNNLVSVSYLFSLFYCMSTFYLDYGFLNMDLGMLSVISFLPLVIFGFLKLLITNNWLELSFGMTLVMFSHVLSIFIISGFLLGWLLINKSNVNRYMIKNIIKAALTTILVTSIFWIPFIHLILLNMGNMNRPGGANLFGTSFYNMIDGAIFGKGTYSLSIVPIIGIVLSILMFKHFNRINKQMFIISIIFLILCSNIFPWKITTYGILRVFRAFQFTWRLYVIPQVLLCYLNSVSVHNIYMSLNNKYIKRLIVCCIFLIIISCQFISQKYIINNNYYSHELTTSFIQNNMTSINKPQYIHHKRVYFHTTNLPHATNIKLPPRYKIINQFQYSNAVSPYFVLGGIDYYPMSTLGKLNNIVNNYAWSNKYRILIKHSGYNQILFDNKSRNTEFYLPILEYKGENIRIKINNVTKRLLVNKYGVVKINNVKRGLNKVKINIIPYYIELILELSLFLIGILIYVFNIRKEFINRSRNKYEKDCK